MGWVWLHGGHTRSGRDRRGRCRRRRGRCRRRRRRCRRRRRRRLQELAQVKVVGEVRARGRVLLSQPPVLQVRGRASRRQRRQRQQHHKRAACRAWNPSQPTRTASVLAARRFAKVVEFRVAALYEAGLVVQADPSRPWRRLATSNSTEGSSDANLVLIAYAPSRRLHASLRAYGRPLYVTRPPAAVVLDGWVQDSAGNRNEAQVVLCDRLTGPRSAAIM